MYPAEPGPCFSSPESPTAHSTVSDSSRCLLTTVGLMTGSFNNCLLMLVAGQALGGQRLETVPVITKCKSGKGHRQVNKQLQSNVISAVMTGRARSDTESHTR